MQKSKVIDRPVMVFKLPYSCINNEKHLKNTFDEIINTKLLQENIN